MSFDSFLALWACAMFVPLAALSSPVDWIVLVWILFVGGCVGSFLNVVIYRVPAGKSIVYPGSMCLKCGHAIRPLDNMPIVSWLWLRGRCRDCGAAISWRYPVVEAIVAALFVSLAVSEVFLAGANLPRGRVGWSDPESYASLWIILALHLTLLSTLLCAALISIDSDSVPLSVFLPALIVAIVVPLIWPEVRPLRAFTLMQFSGWKAGLSDGLAGMMVGVYFGLHAFPLAVRDRFRIRKLVEIVAATTLCGAVLGWQAAAIVTCAAFVGQMFVALLSLALPTVRRVTWATMLALAAGSFIFAWRWLVEEIPSLGKDAGPLLVGGGGILVLVSSLVTFWSKPRQRVATRRERK